MSATDRARVLVVDDELGPRESLRMLLKPSYDIATAESGGPALDMLARFQPDLVFMDIKMPRDGRHRAVPARSSAPTRSIEVVMITAYASLETVKNALTHGAFEYLIKPFSPPGPRGRRPPRARAPADRARHAQPGRPARRRDARALRQDPRARGGGARRAGEQSLRVTQLSILREISRTHRRPARLRRAHRRVTEQLAARSATTGRHRARAPRRADGDRPHRAWSCLIRDDSGTLGYLGRRQPRRRGAPIDPRERELLEMLSEYLADRHPQLAALRRDRRDQAARSSSSSPPRATPSSPSTPTAGSTEWNPAAERIFGCDARQAHRPPDHGAAAPSDRTGRRGAALARGHAGARLSTATTKPARTAAARTSR